MRVKWVTRENVHVDRVACPWLIKKFIDSEAEFVFVPSETDPAGIKEGMPFDMRDVELGHHGDKCSFDAIMNKFRLTSDPSLVKIERIVRLADTGRGQEEPLALALEILAKGFRSMSESDQETLTREFYLYDALYAYFQQEPQQASASGLPVK